MFSSTEIFNNEILVLDIFKEVDDMFPNCYNQGQFFKLKLQRYGPYKDIKINHLLEMEYYLFLMEMDCPVEILYEIAVYVYKILILNRIDSKFKLQMDI